MGKGATRGIALSIFLTPITPLLSVSNKIIMLKHIEENNSKSSSPIHKVSWRIQRLALIHPQMWVCYSARSWRGLDNDYIPPAPHVLLHFTFFGIYYACMWYVYKRGFNLHTPGLWHKKYFCVKLTQFNFHFSFRSKTATEWESFTPGFISSGKSQSLSIIPFFWSWLI